MQKSLSGNEVCQIVMKAIGEEPNIITYNELDKIRDIDDILKNNMCVILYETSEGYGHWTCVFKDRNTIEHFDSYGLFPDKELKFVSKDINKMLGQGYPMLSKLLYDCPYDIRYCNKKFQGEDSSTCGRWCAMRLIFKILDEYDFIRLCKGIGDKEVTKITDYIASAI